MQYNPIKAAAVAAWSELSSPEAIQFYGDRAWSDTLTTYATVRSLCIMVIQMGQFCRSWCDDLVQASVQPQAALALPESKFAGYLPEISSAPRKLLPPAKSSPERITPIGVIIPPDFNGLGIRELRRLCSERGIPRASRLSKVQAIAALENSPLLA